MSFGGYGFGGGGGQRERFDSGAQTELVLPVQQTAIQAACLLIVLLALLGIAAIIGPVLGFLIVLGGIAAGAVMVYRGAPRWYVIATGIVAAACWLNWGYELVASVWPGSGLRWQPWLCVVLVCSLLIVIFCALWLCYRMSYEVADPKHSPPRRPIERTTAVWPWTREPEPYYGEPDPPAPKPRDPVMIHNYVPTRTPPAEPTAATVEDASADELELQRIKTFISRGAREGFTRGHWEKESLCGEPVTQSWWNATTKQLKAQNILTVRDKATVLNCSVRDAIWRVK